MTRTTSLRTYGKTRTKPMQRFSELPQSPIRRTSATQYPDVDDTLDEDDSVIQQLTAQLEATGIEASVRKTRERGSPPPEASIQSPPTPSPSPPAATKTRDLKEVRIQQEVDVQPPEGPPRPQVKEEIEIVQDAQETPEPEPEQEPEPEPESEPELRVLAWHDVCPPGDTITKIAEASYAEVYRVRNERGTSIIKVIRLSSPIKAQTKAQVRSGLVDEEPHEGADLMGELRISEWLADVPGFVVYKERYVVQGRAPKALLETHQVFHRRLKRQDPDRLQFYPSPSRYLDDTRFMVVELGDAGVALEDFELVDVSQLWDIFFHVAVALARAEELIAFEHRDLHEGNLCIRRMSEARQRDPTSKGPVFGYSGLDITILDYGLSRAEDPSLFDELEDFDDETPEPEAEIVALDLEKDLSIFTSTHAPQCKVYRQMRSFLVHGGASRKCLPPSGHKKPYPTITQQTHDGPDAELEKVPLSWTVSAPYTNVLWLAYTYQYVLEHFQGEASHAAAWRRETAQLWRHLNPEAKAGTPVFGCAAEVVRFAVEAGWIGEEQIMGGGPDGTMISLAEREDSIILGPSGVDGDVSLRVDQEMSLIRRSPRKRRVSRRVS